MKSYLHSVKGSSDTSLFHDAFTGLRPSKGDHMSNRGSIYDIYHDATFHVDLTQKSDRID